MWRAHDQVLSRDVAVKVLAGRYATQPDAREHIHHEARSAASLSHPNIAQVYDFGESDDGTRTAYVMMELVPGGTLEQRLQAGPLPAKVAFRICAEVGAGLAAAHAYGLVHRDVKPANIMMTPNGAKVVDFGIAAAARPDGAGDPEEELFGTPSYLAPERLTGDAVQPATDVYALGVLLYKLLAGHAPWDADTTTKMLNAHIYTEPTPLPPLPGVPDDVIDLCHRSRRRRSANHGMNPRDSRSLTNSYPTGIRISDRDMRAFEAEHVTRHTFHGNWNYDLLPAVDIDEHHDVDAEPIPTRPKQRK